ncbi:MAG: DNA repair protein RadC [Firmicutes bacterium]|nr:DNA repair protein RadC [Bacillota bacterium]MDD4263250.1 DNA repair protein RadC [Bacillota bacterium]MDD4692865.1 DNA repair protein RadC [Bacillota bacterium]
MWSIKKLPENERPREKLARWGANVLSNQELLAILLGSGYRGVSAISLADKLLCKCGGLKGLKDASLSELLEIPGIGEAKGISILALIELSRRLHTYEPENMAMIESAGEVFDLLGATVSDLDRERFIVLLLDNRHRLLGVDTISIGSLDASIVHPRELFKSCIRRSAAGVVLVHNHPSGDPRPSFEDKLVTERIIEAGKLLGICVLDHVILAGQTYYSMKEHGLMD